MHVALRFYAELNDFLAPQHRFRTIERTLYTTATVKDIIESLGVPHTEVELITINDESCGFDRLVQDGDRVAVYPMFEALDISSELRVREAPLRHPRFVLDTHLGRLAAYLRMLGFDTLYSNHADDAELAETSRREHRMLLTRDTGLLKRSAVTHGYFVRETAPRRQTAEVIHRFDISAAIAPFTRCMVCNGVLEPTAAASVKNAVPAPVAARHTDFLRCRNCSRVYWKGSHWERMRAWVHQLRAS